MQGPTVADLLVVQLIQDAVQQAWQDSWANDPLQRHEEGGWLYLDPVGGQYSVMRAARGVQAVIDLTNPPVISGSMIVATFHTHPNPAAEGWATGPGAADISSAQLLGLPCIIRAEDGIHTCGPP